MIPIFNVTSGRFFELTSYGKADKSSIVTDSTNYVWSSIFFRSDELSPHRTTDLLQRVHLQISFTTKLVGNDSATDIVDNTLLHYHTVGHLFAEQSSRAWATNILLYGWSCLLKHYRKLIFIIIELG